MENAKKVRKAMDIVLLMGRGGLPDSCEWLDVWDQWDWMKENRKDVCPEDWDVLGELIGYACLADGMPNLMRSV